MSGRSRREDGRRSLTQVREVTIIKYLPNCKKIKGLRGAKEIEHKCTRRWLFWQSKSACNHF